MNAEVETKPLDFGALSLPVTSADIEAFRQSPRHVSKEKSLRNRKILKTAVIITVIAFGLPIAVTAIGQLSNGWSSDGLSGVLRVVLIALVFFAVIFVIIRAVLRHRWKKLVRLERFADANGLTMCYDARNPRYEGMIFDEGHSRKLNEALTFPGLGQIGNYTYTVGSGKNSHTFNVGFVKIPLGRNLPHMVLDAKKNNYFGMSNLTDSFDRSQTLSLEGDFNTHYTLYVPKQYERDALYVFTPDVMAALVDSGAKYDMEVVGDSLFVYGNTAFDLLSETQLRSLLALMSTIGSQLRTQSRRYEDERVESSVAGTTIAPQGARLKHGVNVVAIIITVLVIGVMLWGLLD